MKLKEAVNNLQVNPDLENFMKNKHSLRLLFLELDKNLENRQPKKTQNNLGWP